MNQSFHVHKNLHNKEKFLVFFLKHYLKFFSPLVVLPTSSLKSKKPHNFFNIYRNLMRIALFERSCNYLPSLEILEKENIY